MSMASPRSVASSHELATAPAAQSEVSGATKGANAQRSAAQPPKSAIVCRNFLLGHCRYGRGCRFVHKVPERGDVGMPNDISGNSNVSALQAALGLQNHVAIAANRPLQPQPDAAQLLAIESARIAEQLIIFEHFRLAAIEAEQRRAAQKERILQEAAERQVQEAERLLAIQNAQKDLTARMRKAAQMKAVKRARDAERERVRLAAEEAARTKKLEAEKEAARRREARAREEAARQTQLAEGEARRIRYDAAVTSQHIVFGSTLITCGAGLEVRGVVSGFDSCRLTIHNLPLDTKVPEIIQLFTAQGMNSEDIHILSVRPTNGKRLEAKVLTSADEGRAIAIGLNGIEFRDATLRFDVGENTSVNAMGESSARQADTLIVTWTLPCASMIAKYPSIVEAHRGVRDLDQKVVNGRRIKAEMNKPPVGPALRYYTPESVKIVGLPVDASLETIVSLAGTAFVRPIRSNTYNLEVMLSDLRQHLEALPNNGLRTFTIDRDRDLDGIVSVRACFECWDQANAARISLEDKRFRSDSPKMRMFLPPPLHFISTVPLEQFEAQKQLWESLANAEDKGPRIHINRVEDRRIVRVRLSGDDRKVVGALKVRVETLLAGEKLDATYWHRSFLWPQGRAFLAEVFSETGAFVRGDFKTQALKLYGPERAKELARQMIKDEVARLAQLETTVMLKRQSVGYFVRKGLAALKEVIGEDSVTLELASKPCKLTIRGGEEARHALDTIMEQSLQHLDVHDGGTRNDVCPICYDVVSHPFKLGCKHVYCTACIRHYLTSAAETRVFPLVCMGDEDRCKVPVAIPVIQKFLLPQQFEELVSLAFSSYLEQHTQDYKYCTTPDCTQVYRVTKDGMRKLKCPSCFAEVCSACHEEAHEGMTCEERRVRKEQDEKLDDEWAASNNIKRCPGCMVWIQKAEGCNNMHCTRCGVSMCWVCLQSFSTGEQTYEHLTTVHGGAFDGDLV
ncbi:hypothetical protein H0H81_004567 [Sphagnurus paluster]|uniref:RBR-type E3 ubiquitin transferase n=1 Tax=Sphagnurus paluster TaxID=117069 RepID=A0A9P7KJE5_9AGAR|nr:hypothetical protein H0H81_004567 [Sphagnurus paluster]